MSPVPLLSPSAGTSSHLLTVTYTIYPAAEAFFQAPPLRKAQAVNLTLLCNVPQKLYFLLCGHSPLMPESSTLYPFIKYSALIKKNCSHSKANRSGDNVNAKLVSYSQLPQQGAHHPMGTDTEKYPCWLQDKGKGQVNCKQ